MSSVIHNCPECGEVWSCSGCHTREEERLCDSCQMQLDQKTADGIIITDEKLVVMESLVKRYFRNETVPMNCATVLEVISEIKRLRMALALRDKEIGRGSKK